MKTNSIKKNIAFQLVYEILILILPFVTSPYIARVIGATGLGTYSYSSSIAYYFVLFSMLGIINYGNREIARCRDNSRSLSRTASQLVFLHIIISLTVAIFYLIYAFFWAIEKFYALLQIPYVVSALFDISWLYFGLEKFDVTVFVNTLTKILTVFAIFLLVQNTDDLWKYCLILSLGTFFSQIVLWLPLKKYVKFQDIHLLDLRVHIKPLIILFIPALAISLYKYMDKIMLGAMCEKAQLGFYENAEKMINIPMTVITAFGTVMLPKMSNLVCSKDKVLILRYINISMKYIMIIACALAFGLSAISTIFSVIFWGNDFLVCGDMIKGLALTIPFISFANVIRTQYLIPENKDREYLISIIVGAIINVIINAILIPKIGANGAVCGTVVAEISVCVIQSYFTKNILPIKIYIKEIIIFIFVGLLMYYFVSYAGHMLGYHIYTLVLQVLIGVLIYGICTLIILVKRKDENLLDLFTKIKDRCSKNV